MGKYSQVFLNIESVFSDEDLKEDLGMISPQATNLVDNPGSGNVTIYPLNYKGALGYTPFLIVEILPTAINEDFNRSGIEGFIIVQIYTESGFGVKQTFDIADILDDYLQDKKLGTTVSGNQDNLTSTGSSVLNLVGEDRVNNTRFRYDYTVSFVHY